MTDQARAAHNLAAEDRRALLGGAGGELLAKLLPPELYEALEAEMDGLVADLAEDAKDEGTR